MSREAVEWVLKHSRSKGATRLVALVIAHRINWQTNYAYPSLDTIAREAGIRRASVFPCLKSLKGLGELEKDASGGGGRTKTNRYRLTFLAAQGALFDGKTGTPTVPVSISETGTVHEKNRYGGRTSNSSELKPKESSSSIVAAFSAFGFSKPFGHPAFQAAVLQGSAELHNGDMIEVMEKVIQDCNRKVPPAWYQAKRRLEKELRKAKPSSAPATQKGRNLASGNGGTNGVGRNSSGKPTATDPEFTADVRFAIAKSERTGAPADEILRERRALRERQKTELLTNCSPDDIRGAERGAR